jgi:hypothetical protein
MSRSFKVELLHGLTAGGQRHTLAELREPTGRDEAILAELDPEAVPAERISALIEALVIRFGACECPSRDQLLQLTAGDRERLVLAICSALLGPQVDLVTPCPHCGNLTEVPIRFDQVIASRPVAPLDSFELQTERGRWKARCRPPNGADLAKAVRGGTEAARELIAHCLLALSDPAGNQVAANTLPVECEADLAAALWRLDPIAECRIEMECPSCGGGIGALIDGYAILRTGLGDANRLYGDVYRMARAYHWSEAEILSLPLRRRRHYLAIAVAEDRL